MYNIKCLNPIAKIGLNRLDANYEICDEFADADAVLVRSAVMHDMVPGKNLKAVARAGAGVNNIPLDDYASKGVVVFNTPGANANGVKEAVLTGLLLAARDYVGGIEWVKASKDDANIAKTTEKQKKKYAGTELLGKKIGVIGLGAIGVLVANACEKLGMKVYGYDPYMSIQAAWNLSRNVKHISNVDDIYTSCDYITIHVPAMDATKKMINAAAIDKMSEHTVVLNFARDLLVDEDAMVEALKEGKIRKYVTDFPNPTTAGLENAIVIPHLGASTEESEDNCAVMACDEIKDFLENGNIKNSVNYPACDMGKCMAIGRIAVCHKNIPNMIAQLTSACAKDNINISDMINKSRGDYAYTMLDLEQKATDKLIKDLEAINGIIKVRIVK